MGEGANRALPPRVPLAPPPKDLTGFEGLSCKRLSLKLLVSAMYFKGYRTFIKLTHAYYKFAICWFKGDINKYSTYIQGAIFVVNNLTVFI